MCLLKQRFINDFNKATKKSVKYDKYINLLLFVNILPLNQKRIGSTSHSNKYNFCYSNTKNIMSRLKNVSCYMM